jgi:putative glutamine amidotransferase
MSRLVGVTAGAGRNGERPAQVLNTAYVDAVARTGAVPVVVPILSPDAVDAVLDRVDALVLSGGGDVDPACYGQHAVAEVYGVNRARDEWELALARGALARGMPLLAICRGLQVLNVACGGTLVQHLAAAAPGGHRQTERGHEPVHQVSVDAGSCLAAVLGVSALGVNTLHHQAIDAVGDGLRVVARSVGDGVVEGVEATDADAVLGVQWHPELLADEPVHARLFAWIAGQRRSSSR